jgi:myo-inositol catabolism protein IolC
VIDLRRVPPGDRLWLGKCVRGILVDEEFGADIMRNAARHGYVTALSTEKTGSEEFEFEYGTAFAKHTSKRFSQPSRRGSSRFLA